jgi:hypothetical protein
MAGEKIVGWIDSAERAQKPGSLQIIVKWMLSAPVNSIVEGGDYFLVDTALSDNDLNASIRAAVAQWVTNATGQAFTIADVKGFPAVRTGTVTVVLTDLTKAVAFTKAMPSANYRLMLQPAGNLAVTLWGTAKTTAGFTINLSVGVNGTIDYIAVED